MNFSQNDCIVSEREHSGKKELFVRQNGKWKWIPQSSSVSTEQKELYRHSDEVLLEVFGNQLNRTVEKKGNHFSIKMDEYNPVIKENNKKTPNEYTELSLISLNRIGEKWIFDIAVNGEVKQMPLEHARERFPVQYLKWIKNDIYQKLEFNQSFTTTIKS